jgi:predicted glycosyltransferase involved in capsule biosynthesis
MEMNDMKVDFLIPCRIESEDRLRNAITSVSYLLSNFPESRVIIKEVDTKSHFKFRALPEIKKYTNIDNLVHIFEESSDEFFHKTKILNDLLIESSAEIVFNHDVDMILPKSTYYHSYQAIVNDKCEVIYPYGCGAYQWAVDYPMNIYDEFIQSFNIDILKKNAQRSSSTIGWGQMIRRQTYIECGMWNENFISWGAEDCEFYYRLAVLGFRLGRVDDDIYHLEHGRTFNSHYNNPKFRDNHNLWQWIRNQNAETIVDYYNQQEYIKRRGEQLNARI